MKITEISRFSQIVLEFENTLSHQQEELSVAEPVEILEMGQSRIVLTSFFDEKKTRCWLGKDEKRPSTH